MEWLYILFGAASLGGLFLFAKSKLQKAKDKGYQQAKDQQTRAQQEVQGRLSKIDVEAEKTAATEI